MTPLNTAAHREGDATLARGTLLVFFTRSHGADRDVYEAERGLAGDPFGPPVPLPELNSPSSDDDPWLSEDGRTVLFASNRSGQFDLYEARR